MNILTPHREVRHCSRQIRWALASAQWRLQDADPFVCYLALPHPTGHYQPWISHRLLAVLATFQPGTLGAPKAAGYTLTELESTQTGKRGWVLACIANKTGREWHKEVATGPLREGLALARPTWQATGPWGLEGDTKGDRMGQGRFSHLTPSKFISLSKKGTTRDEHRDTHEVQGIKHIYSAPPRLPNRRWNPETIYYSDGSRVVGEEGIKCGAGLHHPGLGVNWRIDPRGSGATNTINRAELAQASTTTSLTALTSLSAQTVSAAFYRFKNTYSSPTSTPTTPIETPSQPLPNSS